MSLYSPRIKTYYFGSMTASAGGTVNTTTTHPIVGELIKIDVDNINTAAAGSIFVQSNPIGNMLITHGSVIATGSGDAEVYFGFNAQRGNATEFPVVAEPITLSGAGFGNGSSVVPVLYYR